MRLILSLLSVCSVDWDWLLSLIDLVFYLAVSMVLPVSDALLRERLCSDSSFAFNFDE